MAEQHEIFDKAVAAAFSVSALLWVIAAPFWAKPTPKRVSS